MTFDDIKLNIAENLNQLSTDGSTIVEGRVTDAGIGRKVNNLYREELFPLLSDKYPQDFEQETYPQATYTANSTVSSVSTTTLIIDDAVFNNSMEGFEIENATQESKIKIKTFTSTTQVEMVTSVADWNAGDTLYILGNIYTFGGDAANLKEVSFVAIQYRTADNYFRTCQRSNQSNLFMHGNETYSRLGPRFYLTAQDVGGKQTQAIGFQPPPESYQGKFYLRYTERPAAMTSSDEPLENIPGISQVIIDGVTAWGFAVMEKWKSEGIYLAKFERGKMNMVSNYKPKSRAGAVKMKLPGKYSLLKSRRI